MSIKIPKPVLFGLSFLFAFTLYWRSMQGTPIWDDFTFWFSDPVMKPSMSYASIWKNFAWPLSVSAQKILLAIWGKSYFNYHLLNFVLHFINSLLVYQLGRFLRFKYPFVFFIFFLTHPASVISTAWMIQIKTLLCFLFGLAAVLAFFKGNKDLKWMIFSWVLFLCSILSKSASLTLPLIFLIISFRTYKFSKLYLLIPFFIISLWGSYKVLTSPITLQGAEKASHISKIKTEETPTAKPLKQVVPATPSKKSTGLSYLQFDYHLVAQTLNYYFWQSLVPVHNEPIKGLNFKKAGVTELIHIFFLFTLIVILWKDISLIYLAAAHILLIPFLGFIPAPFMNITWVSDQHLYLVLPTILAFWLRLIEKMNWKFSYLIPAGIILIFSYKTYEANAYYKDHFVFYKKSIQYNPYNVPITYNYAFAKLTSGKGDEAYQILESAYSLSQIEPVMQKNAYYPHLVRLYIQLKMTKEKANEN